MTIRFGTDGWRGIMSREVTFRNVRRLAAAVGAHLEAQGTASRGVAVGFDRRLLSDRYAAEAAGVLAARGIPVRLAPGPVPTPAVSWAAREQELAGGLMVTASHNPPEWNGIKFKEAFGGSAGGAVSRRIEELVAEGPSDAPCLDPDAARRKGLLTDLEVWEAYRRGIRRLVDFDAIRRARPTVAVDAMHGCGTPWLRRLLEEAGCRVRELRAEWNPGFGGHPPEPVAAYLRGLEELVAREGCALGVANDGDADRIAAVDERGRYFSPQRILAVLLRYLREAKGLPGEAAKTVSATSMVDLLAEGFGMEVLLTPIGFKHIGEAMLERPIVVGGEESGGIGVGAHLPDRDGILNALLLVEIVAASGKGLRAYLQEVFDRVGYFTYDRVDLSLGPAAIEAARRRIEALDGVDRLAGRPVHQVVRIDGVRLLRDDHSWLLLRPSGTEPLVRVYAEARSAADVEALLREGRRLVGAG